MASDNSPTERAYPESIDDGRDPLFTFIAQLAAGVARRELSPMQTATALRVLIDSKGTTGRGVTVRLDDVAAELGISGRQVWRHFGALIDLGWFEQTDKPARPYKGGEGRRARYRVTLPSVLTSHAERVTEPGGGLSHAAIESPSACDSFDSQRVTVLGPACDSPHRELGTLTPSDGIPSDGIPSGTDQKETADRAHEPEARNPGIDHRRRQEVRAKIDAETGAA